MFNDYTYLLPNSAVKPRSQTCLILSNGAEMLWKKGKSFSKMTVTIQTKMVRNVLLGNTALEITVENFSGS